MADIEATAKAMREERIRRGWSTTELANRARAVSMEAGDTLKLSQQLVSQFENNQTKQIPRWHRYVTAAFAAADAGTANKPDLPMPIEEMSYLSVNVLPSYGGMGGGGSGEGDKQVTLLPRALVEDQLRAKPDDLILLDVRGDSMEPDFQHGDQILIDKRDRNPAQPGTFALWDGDAYVVKIVERVPRQRGRYRVFSANNRYSPAEYEEEEITIMGRPVWFARRL